jgi:hypothetical protein
VAWSRLQALMDERKTLISGWLYLAFVVPTSVNAAWLSVASSLQVRGRGGGGSARLAAAAAAACRACVVITTARIISTRRRCGNAPKAPPVSAGHRRPPAAHPRRC